MHVRTFQTLLTHILEGHNEIALFDRLLLLSRESEVRTPPFPVVFLIDQVLVDVHEKLGRRLLQLGLGIVRAGPVREPQQVQNVQLHFAPFAERQRAVILGLIEAVVYVDPRRQARTGEGYAREEANRDEEFRREHFPVNASDDRRSTIIAHADSSWC